MPALLDDADIEALVEEDDDEGLLYEEDDDDAEEDDDEAYYYAEEDEDEAYYGEEDDYDAVYAEEDEDEGLGEGLEERRYFGRRPRSRRRGRSYRRPAYYRRYLRRRPATGRRLRRGLTRGLRGVRTLRVRTPRGTAQIRLPATVARRQDLKTGLTRLSTRVRGEILKNSRVINGIRKSVSGLDTTQRRRLSGLEGKLSRFEKGVNKKITDSQSQAQMFAMLPLMMQSQPKLESLTLAPAAASEYAYNVTNRTQATPATETASAAPETMTLEPEEDASYKFKVMETKATAVDQSNMMLPLVMMMGLGGGGGSQNQMMMLLLMMQMMNK